MSDKIYQSEQINELAAALAKAQADFTHAKKSEENPFFKSKYADMASVYDASRPYLAKHGLSVMQLTEVDETGKISLRTQLNHSSGQWIRGWYPINPMKADPQGLGATVTYARRYAYAAITGVATEDDDGNLASGNTGKRISPTNGDKTANEVYGSSAAWGRAMDKIEKDWSEAETIAELDKATKENKIHLEAVQQIDPECHADMQKKYKAHKTRIEQDKMIKNQLGE